LRHAVGMNASRPAESKSQPENAKRRTWSDEERDLIVQASLKKGTTVNAVARLYGVQPWQIYDWRKKARQVARQTEAASLVPVQVTEPDETDKVEPKERCSVVIEAQSARITITGLIDAVVVRTVLECLAR
jgi:transposase-like protein